LVRERSYSDPNVIFTPGYDSYGRITTHRTHRNGSDLVKFTYTYDLNSNITGQSFDHRDASPDNIYTYDDLDRLVEADYLVGVLTQDEQFTYDDLGNRITLNNRAGNDVVYAHNVANEYTSIGGTNVSHDAAGNLSADPNGYTYEYDNDNRLTKIKDSGAATVAEFTYDALGRRIEAIDSVAATTTRYYYDGWRVLSETNAAGTKQRHYVYGNYLDEALLLIHDDGQATPTYTDYYYAHNHLYSPTALIEADGDVVERYEYDVYGKCTAFTDDGADDTWFTGDDTVGTSSALGNPILFTGQRLDSLDSGDLQLMYYKNRHYSFNIGRFLQRDPLIYINGMNLYEYVRSYVVMAFDPFGTRSEIYPFCGDCHPDPKAPYPPPIPYPKPPYPSPIPTLFPDTIPDEPDHPFQDDLDVTEALRGCHKYDALHLYDNCCTWEVDEDVNHGFMGRWMGMVFGYDVFDGYCGYLGYELHHISLICVRNKKGKNGRDVILDYDWMEIKKPGIRWIPNPFGPGIHYLCPSKVHIDPDFDYERPFGGAQYI
jgi:RHS repeat-associated protein